MCLPACLPACLSACLPACLSACLPACLSACLLVCLPACLPVCLSLCVCLFRFKSFYKMCTCKYSFSYCKAHYLFKVWFYTASLPLSPLLPSPFPVLECLLFLPLLERVQQTRETGDPPVTIGGGARGGCTE